MTKQEIKDRINILEQAIQENEEENRMMDDEIEELEEMLEETE